MSETTHNQHRQRLRERCLAAGLDTFQQHEILELLLTYAIPRRDVNPLAHKLIDAFGSLTDVLNARYSELIAIDGIGPSTAKYVCAVMELIRFYAADWRRSRETTLRAHIYVAKYFHGILANDTEERICMLCLDIQGHVISCPTIYSGPITQNDITSRDIIQCALRFGTHDVIFAHSTPDENVNPSDYDMRLASLACRALSHLEISVLDYMNIGKNNYVCFSANDIMPKENTVNASYKYYTNRVGTHDLTGPLPIPDFTLESGNTGAVAAESKNLILHKADTPAK